MTDITQATVAAQIDAHAVVMPQSVQPGIAVVVPAGSAVLPPPPPELGNLGGAALKKYADAAAKAIEDDRDKLKAQVEAILDNLTNSAAGIRELGDIASTAAVDATVKMQEAAKDSQALLARFKGA